MQDVRLAWIRFAVPRVSPIQPLPSHHSAASDRTRTHPPHLPSLPTALAGLLTAIFVAACSRAPERPSAQSTGSALEKIRATKTIRVGFSGYPPFLSIDPTTKMPSGGFSVDLLNTILKEWNEGITVEWVPTNWSNVRVDLLAGRFDLIVEPVFRTIPRAAIVGFSRPYAYFAYACGCVRADDDRFHSIEQLNSDEYTICVLQGASAHEYVKKHLPRATRLKVLSGTSVEATLDEVLLGRVDITLADLHTIDRYVKAHPGKVKAVFTDPPPGRVPAGFMCRPGDYRFVAFLNVALEYLEASGDIERLKRMYGIR